MSCRGLCRPHLAHCVFPAKLWHAGDPTLNKIRTIYFLVSCSRGWINYRAKCLDNSCSLKVLEITFFPPSLAPPAQRDAVLKAPRHCRITGQGHSRLGTRQHHPMLSSCLGAEPRLLSTHAPCAEQCQGPLAPLRGDKVKWGCAGQSCV